MATTHFFPQDIITDILKRLLVKSLIRFQCVCKHWRHLLKTPSFVAENLRHSTHQNSVLLFQGYRLFDPSGWCFLDHEMQVQSAPEIGSLLGVRIVGAINGLLCFRPDNASIFLWNPAIRQFHCYRIARIHVSVNSRVISSEECLLDTNLVNEVHVYSLSTGSWKGIEFGNLNGVSLMSNGLHAIGSIFWFGFMLNVGEEDENDGHLVVSFDIATEVFTLIPLPTSAPKSYRNRLSVHENKLAMLSHTPVGNSESSVIDLWVMEEGTGVSGERWNWTKKYSSRPYPFLLNPGSIWRNEIVCIFLWIGTERERNRSKGKVVLFNITANKIKMLATPKYGDGDGLFFNYVESLVPVGNDHIEEFDPRS
ncbi:F-box/kelch-repeat protein At3g23880-like [Prosopis cineraria]|uniref:F-box/kelch-repeat protein At3g23880-like n=1 Tax=Prosopis cineraria TaxID=364024 RepID=UPI00241064CA|nr:F-box/kelch-repeat protein At3g23880-like [Prosopis cineraria]